MPEDDLDFQAIEAQFGTATQEFHIGAGTIAVPGVAPGLAEAHARFGRIPLPDLVAPACKAARTGIEITPFQAELSRIVEAILIATPSARSLWTDAEGLLPTGATARNPEIADVLEVFAAEGPRFVTEGEVAQALLALCDQGGQITADDLRNYAPAWRHPLVARRGATRIHLNPAPSMGGTLIAFGLGICPDNPSPATLLRTLDATLVARIETEMDKDPRSGAQRLLDPDLLAQYRVEIAHRPRALRGTTHISVIDADGMGAALTLSNGEGCGHVLPGTGIMPNNMLGEDDLMPAGMHSWAPGQRLSSMMCPMAIEWPDGRAAMLGSGGSNRIRSALLQVAIGLIDRNLPPDEAIAAARLHVDGDAWAPRADFEDLGDEFFRDAVLETAPEARAWPEPSMFFGGAHLVEADGRGSVRAAGDPRRAGASRTG